MGVGASGSFVDLGVIADAPEQLSVEGIQNLAELLLEVLGHRVGIDELVNYLGVSGVRQVVLGFKFADDLPLVRLEIVAHQLHKILVLVLEKYVFLGVFDFHEVVELLLGLQRSDLTGRARPPSDHVVLEDDPRFAVLQTVMEDEKVHLISREPIDNWLVEISSLVYPSVVHVAIPAAESSLGSDQNLLFPVVHQHRGQLGPFGLHQQTEVVDPVIVFSWLSLALHRVRLADVEAILELRKHYLQSVVEALELVEGSLNPEGILGLGVDQVSPVSVDVYRSFLEHHLLRLAQRVLEVLQILDFVLV